MRLRRPTRESSPTRRVELALIVLLFAAGCRSSLLSCPRASAPHAESVHVDPRGDDAADGTREAPLRTIGRALSSTRAETIWIHPGVHEIGRLAVDRPVVLLGGGGAETVLSGILDVRSDDVLIRGVSIDGGVVSTSRRRLMLRDVSLTPRGVLSTLSIVGGSASLVHAELTCGADACVEARTATIAIEGASFRSASGVSAKRGLQVVSSSVSARGLVVEGTEIAQIGASRRSALTLRETLLKNAGGNGLAITSGSSVRARELTVTGADDLALVASMADVEIVGGALGPSRRLTLGFQGGRARLVGVDVVGSREGVLSLGAHRGHEPDVTFLRSRFRIGGAPGITVGQGRLSIRDSTIVADPAAVPGHDAVSASGAHSELALARVRIEGASANAVALYSGASLSATARIVRPRGAGIYVEDGAGSRVILDGVEVSDCARGAGIVLLSVTVAEVGRSRVERCAEGGLVAGEGTEVTVDTSRFSDNGQFGVAAFGGAQVALERSEVRGSPWALYASCAEGSAVRPGAESTVEGGAVKCP